MPDYIVLTGIEDAHYVVCDRCAYLWDIESQWHDPVICPHCQHRSLWRFPMLANALGHSELIRLRNELDARGRL